MQARDASRAGQSLLVQLHRKLLPSAAGMSCDSGLALCTNRFSHFLNVLWTSVESMLRTPSLLTIPMSVKSLKARFEATGSEEAAEEKQEVLWLLWL